MDHGAVIRRHRRVLTYATLTLAALLLLAWPTAARAATLVDPVDGNHFDHLELAPMVQFDPGEGEHPRWVLLATDPEMKTQVRYCRQFVWAASGGSYHWGCNRWATGADQFGNDQLLALEPGTVYYWQVVSKPAEGDVDVTSDVRSFAIDEEPTQPTVAEVSNHINGTVFDDGTQLNLGAAAYVNSRVRVKSIASSRLATYAFRIRLTHIGAVDLRRSYVRVTSAAGTRYLRLGRVGTSSASTVWRLTASERRLRTKRFTYQAFLKSAKNGAMVRSQARVVVIRRPARPPAWKAD